MSLKGVLDETLAMRNLLILIDGCQHLQLIKCYPQRKYFNKMQKLASQLVELNWWNEPLIDMIFLVQEAEMIKKNTIKPSILGR
jgi:hypothetical protein